MTLEGYVRSMRLLYPVSEDEVIAVFLRGELDSSRYGEKLRAFLARDGRELGVVRSPDPGDADANAYRRQLLDGYRGYERREGLFLGFPRAVEWFGAALERDEVLDILFIDWDWWLELSGGTRRPLDAAHRIWAGDVAGVTAEEHEPLARASDTQPELIAVTTPAHTPLALVEGHFRLTAYALFPEHVPEEFEILLGMSDEMPQWCQF
jgi:hypothetical protein